MHMRAWYGGGGGDPQTRVSHAEGAVAGFGCGGGAGIACTLAPPWYPLGMRVLFVCLGNICRSPLAEGIFRRHVERAGLHEHIHIDSAGTGNWHVGEPPDRRAQACAQGYGVDITGLRARQFSAEDFDRFDYILVMDNQNHANVLRLARNDAHRNKVSMMLSHGSRGPVDVPDPYFGGDDGFHAVFAMLEEACAGLLETVRREAGR